MSTFKGGKKARKTSTVLSKTVVSAKDCKHLRVREGACLNCDHQVPFYGSFFDTGTVKTLIKVVFIDESKKSRVPFLSP